MSKHKQRSVVPKALCERPRYVKINADRGHGDDKWQIVSEDHAHYFLRNTVNNKHITIYKVHTKPTLAPKA